MTCCKELEIVFKKLKKGKAPGLDRISNEMIKTSFVFLQDLFVILFNLILKIGVVPENWCKEIITPVHKSGDPLDLDNYGSIHVLSCLGKFFTNTLDMRSQDVLKKCKIIHCAQIGFTEKHQTTDHIVTLKSLISKHAVVSQKGMFC